MNRVPLVGLAALMALACSKAGPPVKGPTAAEHEQLAMNEEQAAEAHDMAISQAAGPHASYAATQEQTKTNQEQANVHRKRAAEHRAAARELRSEEAQACEGILEEDRDTNPLQHREDITSVTTIEESPPPAMDVPDETRTVGAKIVVRARPAMTAEWLQRNVDCYMARTGAGPTTPDMVDSPLSLDDIDATVTSTGDGFAISVTSDDKRVVKEIIRRSEALEK
ncbi:MAG TPA: hypothetical protein VM686_22740 [Polyangiaceae bacterium]|nr:hypothetical protein [Polyangiaceae bacterium]